ncbi:MAG: DUF1801 domain-containing protein [Gemmatimonadota bacterium]|nr:DUF1801 domain-containing protein [Gemmatimonadota bacterium]
MKASPSPRKDAKSEALKLRAYFASLPPDARRRVEQLRETIRGAAPTATEVISYGIPAFRLNGRVLVWYASWKNHSSLYPITVSLRRGYERELKGYETSKGTIRLPLARPLPTGLVRRLVKARIAELRPNKSKAR